MSKTNPFAVQVRKRKFDGKHVRWELREMSNLKMVDPVEGKDGKMHTPHDHKLWVVTGIFDSRKEAFSK